MTSQNNSIHMQQLRVLQDTAAIGLPCIGNEGGVGWEYYLTRNNMV